ncbi:pyridoxal 5'-phosphate synthase glutaminase subunit PdxT [Acetobacterium woodii]|uniref:Pyridoxal 5'-phosphate synthase subunit PdxT n=1 Tax=Acetobacterium woodii (strain ATCC 29683 / DSM 1030 / JCM 2381 / KCTC 1655 / WB1) TaxID=931626 RepID=H6LIE9_ACEWD|nr:pyridoxal 5'-phosphate synthase glutaminase subunit PdxT [Acetobacterium woodii]AFA47323.1 glutamine amidotransferase subunit PdxT [Acetobacterium woodii DSM 1030]
MQKKIGVLAVQGAFAEHIRVLQKLDVHCIEIRKKADLESSSLNGLVLPGGESTVMGKLLRELELFDPIKKQIDDGLPVLGTCAGLILLAEEIAEYDTVHLGNMHIMARRNAYGRQSGSFQTEQKFAQCGKIPMVFIRAPYIESVDTHVEILAKVNHHIVAARQENIVVTSFHPELTDDLTVHKYFLNIVHQK